MTMSDENDIQGRKFVANTVTGNRVNLVFHVIGKVVSYLHNNVAGTSLVMYKCNVTYLERENKYLIKDLKLPNQMQWSLHISL